MLLLASLQNLPIPPTKSNLTNTTFPIDYTTNKTSSTATAYLAGNHSMAGHWIFKGDRISSSKALKRRV